MSEKNYLEEFVIEDAAIEEFLQLIGRRRFNSLANQVKKVSDKIDKTNFSDADDEALLALDVYFPIDEAKGALEYFKALSRFGFAKRLYNMCTRIEEKIKET